MEHAPISDSHCALAGGDKSPQTPLRISSPKAAKKAAKAANKKQAERLDNHLSFRADDDVWDIVAERMARTGETQSDAIRAIIRKSQDTTGNVYLAPRTPPIEFEDLLGEIRKWRFELRSAKARLNVSTPTDDDPRHAEVVAWRQKADKLLADLSKVEAMLNVCLGAMTSLTPEKVTKLIKGHRILADLKEDYIKGDFAGSAKYIEILTDFLEDAGIKPEGHA